MAIYYARKNGNVNAADVWATTPSGTASDVFSTFTNQDVLISNSFTITLNVNTTVLEIRNDTTGGATNGGSFTLNAGVTLNANCISGTIALLGYSGGIGASSTIVGNITSNGGNTVTFNQGSGTLNIIGSLNSVSGTALYINGGNTVNITGNINAIGSRGIYHVNVNTNINLTGNINCVGGVGIDFFNGFGATTAIFSITGNVTGGNVANANGINVIIAGLSVIINGSVLGGNNAVGISVFNSCSATVTRVKGNNFGPGSVGITSQVGISATQTSNVKVYEIEYGPLGQSPTSGPIELVTSNSNVAVFAVRLSTPKTLVDLNNAANLVPSSGNVRSGVSYNYGNNTGSCVIPNPNSVVYGVPVDNTVGSGLLSPVAVWNALTSSIATSGSIGERLKNCSTIATVGKQLEGVL